jgi:Asp-tRNA(Asn)/Glu-tRNA(Gln) amidotransferase C subunit
MDDARLSTLSESVGLDLSPERRAVLAPALEGLLQQFDVLYEVDVDETAPLHSFDARWGESK